MRRIVARLREQARQGGLVWDLGVRGFHWLLVLSVTVAALTGFFAQRSAIVLHLVAGVAIAVLIGFRLVWGVLGGGYARFASFAFGPRATLDYLNDVLARRARRYLGHNPLGGAMVFALLAVLALIVITGTVVLGGFVKQGPLAAFTSFALGRQFIGVHKLLSLLLVAMVAAHLWGVWFESRREGENLAEAMVTGRKHGAAGDPLPGRWRPALAVCAGLAVLGVGGVAGLSAMPALGVPQVPANADFQRECSACHIAYSPGLLPAASWQGIMAHLDTHFGEDASLDPAIARRIETWLVSYAAEHWDTLPAVLIRQSIDAKDPGRITASGFWQRMHRRIPAATFANKEVGGRGNCAACHADAASGMFSPEQIEIPEDAQ